MTLNRFIQNVGVQFQELFWQDVPRYPLLDDFGELKRQARRAGAALARQGAIRDELSKRLAENERRKTALATRTQVYLHVGDHRNAWRYALELDQVRKNHERARADLRKAEKLYHLQRAHLERLIERLAEV